MTRIGLAVALATLTVCPALAFDLSTLPQSCQATIGQIKSDKPRFGQLNGMMAKARKAGDTANFCVASKQTLGIIIDESGKLDACLGEVAADRALPANVIGEMTQLKSYYRSMLDAAKKPENDRFKCDLASLL